jgi:hypothetical protein
MAQTHMLSERRWTRATSGPSPCASRWRATAARPFDTVSQSVTRVSGQRSLALKIVSQSSPVDPLTDLGLVEGGQQQLHHVGALVRRVGRQRHVHQQRRHLRSESAIATPHRFASGT